MEAVDLLTGYADRLKKSEKELKSLERKAKALATKQAEVDEQRLYLEAKIMDHHRDAASLQSEHKDLQLRYMQSVYEQDAAAQRDVQSRRQEIDHQLQGHAQALEELSTALEELEDFAEQSAEIAAQLDSLNFGNAFIFSRQLEPVLINNQRSLESRQEQAKGKLPSYTDEVYREVRSAQDDEYKQQLERVQAERARQQRVQAEKEERSKLTKSAVVDQDTGYLLGYNIMDQDNKVIRFEKVKRVPIASS